MDIFEDGTKIGTAQLHTEGLYTTLSCEIEPNHAIKRLYLAYPYASQYLGIPDENGILNRKIASKNLPKDFCIVASAQKHSNYLPWRGVIDGVTVQAARISSQEILLPMEVTANFPAMRFETKTTDEKQMALVMLDSEGTPQMKEREMTDETFNFDAFGVSEPADLLADDLGSKSEADRPDF